jgi:hypothetical protein
MFLMDRETLVGILNITQSILLDYFYYSPESLLRFFKYFQDFMVDEYLRFYEQADEGYKIELKYDWQSRRELTSCLASYGLHRSLVDMLYFSELELHAFENLIPKCTGVQHDFKQSIERAHS